MKSGVKLSAGAKVEACGNQAAAEVTNFAASPGGAKLESLCSPT